VKMAQVDPSTIRISKLKWKREILDARIAELAGSIAEFGVIQPAIVRERDDGGYELLAGEHRWRAAKRAGLTKLPVVILSVDDVDGELIGLEENLRRYQLDTDEWMVGLARWKELHELKHPRLGRGGDRKSSEAQEKIKTTPRGLIQEAAHRFGVTDETIRRGLARVERLAPDVRRAAVDKKITMSQADELAKLPPAKQTKLLPSLVEKTRDETRAIVKAEKDANPDWMKRLSRLLQEARISDRRDTDELHLPLHSSRCHRRA